MFNFFKNKKQVFTVSAPVNGLLTNLCDVDDPVFAQKLMGDGFAVALGESAKLICSPISAKVVSLPETKHALGLVSSEGDEILVHIGIDTVNLKGKGFTALVKENDTVKQGQPVIELDRELLANEHANLITMVIFTKLSSEHQNWNMVKSFGDQVTTQDVVVKQ